jgi:hypothetical protein
VSRGEIGSTLERKGNAMRRPLLTALAVLILGSSAVLAAGSVQKAPPPAPYKKVSTLVKLPDFVPGLGTLYVDPKTLPAGPFLAYDHKGVLVSTIYMIPLKDIEAHKKFDDLKSPGGRVVNVDMYYNAGHPGVEEPHYHIILWHVTEGDERVAK